MASPERLAVVSGGGTGIGREIARSLAAAGDRVVIIGRRAEVLERAGAEIAAELGTDRVAAIAADLTDPAQVERAAERIGGPVDVLVNNAGDRQPSGFAAGKVADTLVGRAGTPADVAAAVRYLASPEAGYLTGQVIGLNGGAVLGR